jgi:hypothetical protein
MQTLSDTLCGPDEVAIHLTLRPSSYALFDFLSFGLWTLEAEQKVIRISDILQASEQRIIRQLGGKRSPKLTHLPRCFPTLRRSFSL